MTGVCTQKQVHLVTKSSTLHHQHSQPQKQQATTMAANPYISPYTVDERLHRSVMAAQLHNHTIHEVHQRDFRRSRPFKHVAFKPDFNEDSFSGALGTITVVIEGLCFEGAEGWTEVQMLMPERRRLSSQLFGAPSVAPILFGNDRAVCIFSFRLMASQLETWRVELRAACCGRDAFLDLIFVL